MKVRIQTLTLALTLPLLLSASAAQAGTAYVPLPGIQEVGAVRYQTEISIANSSGEGVALDSLQLAAGIDGTQREGVRPSRLSIPAFRTFVLRPSESARGVMELASRAGLSYSARMIGTNGAEIDLPVITAESRGREEERLVVQRLGGAGTTDLVVMNLGKTAASCTASVIEADGRFAIEPVEFELRPLSHQLFANILRSLPKLAQARAEVTCSNEFYAYAQRSDATTGRLTISGASRSGDAINSLTEKLISPDLACSVGLTTCVKPGLVHTSTKADPVMFLSMTPPPATYKILRAHVEIEFSGWNKTNVHGAHGVFYAVVNKNKSLLGSIFLRGPGNNSITLRHGVCPNGGCLKSKVERGFTAVAGSRYVFDYEYNTTTKTTDMRAYSADGLLLARIQDKPNVNNIFVYPGDRIILGLSNPNVNSREEPASIGWKYSNLQVELLR